MNTSLTKITMNYITRIAVLPLIAVAVAKSQTSEVIPMIRVSNTPITDVINNLASQSGINFIISPNLFASPGSSNPGEIPEPKVSLTWTNTTAADALQRLLNENGLAATKDTFTTVTFITQTNEVLHPIDANLLESMTKNAVVSTNPVTRSFQFGMMPLDMVLNEIIKSGHLNIAVDAQLSAHFDPAIRKFYNPPSVSLRWNDLTHKQAFVALCMNYDLVIAKEGDLLRVKLRK